MMEITVLNVLGFWLIPGWIGTFIFMRFCICGFREPWTIGNAAFVFIFGLGGWMTDFSMLLLVIIFVIIWVVERPFWGIHIRRRK